MDAQDELYLSLGVGLTVIGSIGSALGYVIQKKGHIAVIDRNEVHEIQDEATEGYGSNKIWVCGFIVGITGSILTAVALKFGAQSVLSSLSALILVANAIFATKILREPFERHHLYGIILVMIGSIMAVIFGPKTSSKEVTLSYIESCWRNLHFLLFFIVLTIMALIDYILVKLYERKNYKALDNHNITHGANFLMISYVSLAAYFGATNVLFMKSAMIIIGSFDVSYFANYLLYVTFIGIIVVNVLLEYFRQRALVYFDASYVVPIFQVKLILASAIFGAIFFDEFASLSVESLVIFIVAILITLIGVAILAYDVGAVYKKMLKILDQHTPNNIHFQNKEKPLSVRSIARRSFSKRTHRETRLFFPAFHGAGNYIAAHIYYKSPRFVFNETLTNMKSTLDLTPNAGSIDKTKTFSFTEDATPKSTNVKPPHINHEKKESVNAVTLTLPTNNEETDQQNTMTPENDIKIEPYID